MKHLYKDGYRGVTVAVLYVLWMVYDNYHTFSHLSKKNDSPAGLDAGLSVNLCFGLIAI